MMKSVLSITGLVAFGLSILFAPTPAHAGDVKLIKQPSSFPLIISQPGSYRLKGNITVPDENTTAISVQADYVTIDLNGYSIQGPVICTGQPVTSCSPSGSGIGIDGQEHTGLNVRNGFIRGMGDAGLFLGAAARVENVTAASNAGAGIRNRPAVRRGATVIGCMFDRNGGPGIGLGVASVLNSTAVGNRGIGISADTVTGSTANENGSLGISAFSVAGSAANNNSGDGIGTGNGTVANSSALGNSGRGIATLLAIGCTASGNTGSPQIFATGIAGHNLCNTTPCP